MIRVSAFDDLDPVTLYRILRLRAAVFVVEQSCPYLDLDGCDVGATHLWIDLDPSGPTVSAAARVYPAGDDRWMLGRIVTAPDCRGRRLAASLIDRALRTVPPGVTVALNAQSRLEPWYGRWGFGRTGPDFVEDGIAHVPMALATR